MGLLSQTLRIWRESVKHFLMVAMAISANVTALFCVYFFLSHSRQPLIEAVMNYVFIWCLCVGAAFYILVWAPKKNAQIK